MSGPMKRWALVTAVLLANLAAGAIRWRESGPLGWGSLRTLPEEMDGWQLSREASLDPSVVDLLQPDDYVLRGYHGIGSSESLGFFAGYFRSPPGAKGAHSPEVCLPGAGWKQISTREVQIQAGGESFPANQARFLKGSDRTTVTYWYQTATTAYGDPASGKILRFWELLKAGRSDYVFVRINSSSSEEAQTRFAASVYKRLKQHFQ
jgi:EpsI family protein